MFRSLTTASVFIGYRRADSGGATDRLRRALEDLGHTVFFDLEYMRAGDRYRQVINDALDQCDVAIVVIGPEWTTITDRQGRRRLDDPADVHRLEVQRALARPDIAVVPVLVDGARMPDPEDLPGDLRALTEWQAVDLGREWDRGVRAVHVLVEQWVRRRWSAWVEAVAVGGLTGVAAGTWAGLDAIDTHGRDPFAANLLHLMAQRTPAWAVVIAAVLGWAMWRRGRRRAWTAGVRAGALVGAACGIVGSLVHAFGAFWLAPRHPEHLETIKDVSMVTSIAMTGAATGALLGAVFTPSGVRRGMAAGLVAGGVLGWAARVYDPFDHPVQRWVLYAVGVVGAVVAVEYLTRAPTYGRRESRFAQPADVRVAG